MTTAARDAIKEILGRGLERFGENDWTPLRVGFPDRIVLAAPPARQDDKP
jgi:hypothetical protein